MQMYLEGEFLCRLANRISNNESSIIWKTKHYQCKLWLVLCSEQKRSAT